MIKTLLITLFVLIILGLGWSILRSYLLYRKTEILEQNSTAFSRTIPDATMRILVLGDSTAVGTGAENPNLSTAGRLAALYPQADVVNLAINGLKIAGLNTILANYVQTNPNSHFDLVLIQIGANDIIKLTPMKDIDSGLVQVLTTVKQFGGKTIILHSGNIGESHFFPWYVRPWLSSRSYEVRDIYEKESTAFDVTYVDLIDSDADTIIEQSPTEYYADDLLHLNGAGYGLWFNEISKNVSKISTK